jgi:NodT family efflux transporter outer membrane factor (OMF) lipoprotein
LLLNAFGFILMIRISFKTWGLLSGLLASAAACQVTKPYQSLKAPSGQLYRDATPTDTTSLAQLPPKAIFTDTVLQGLITEGLGRNLDLKIALTRLAAAQAELVRSRAAFLPSLSGTASVAESRLAFTQGYGIFTNLTIYQVGLASSWEADVWGKLRSTRRAALANLLASEAGTRAVQTQLVADIAGYYYRLLALDQQLAITEQTVVNRQGDVTTMRLLKRNAVVTGAAVVQSEANQASAEVALPALRRRIREAENALSSLLARPAGPIRRTNLATQVLPGALPTGIPAQLLHRRPDVQQAEFAYRAAFETTNVARTYFYPALTITAAGGFSSLTLQDWFSQGSLFGNVIGGLAQPIFSQGLNRARLRTAQARQREAQYRFEQSLLGASEEVSNALYARQAALEQQQTRVRQLAFLRQSVDFTQELLRYSSSTNYTDVLTSEQSLLAAQLSSIDDRLLELQAGVALYRALGGGWQ